MQEAQISPMEAQRQKEDEEALNHEVNVDGHRLKLRDIFPDAYAARDFRSKLVLLNSKAGGEPDVGPEPESQDEMDLEDKLFSGKNSK